ncbi:hypothetical protein AAVH_14255 [Aphelenchoides avenae]|nr:hypothetical protein AAVH_14255 [Aphelenchus avenae]
MVAKVEGECCSRVVKVGHQCDACGKVMLVDCNSAISNMKSHEDGKRHKARIDLLDKETNPPRNHLVKAMLDLYKGHIFQNYDKIPDVPRRDDGKPEAARGPDSSDQPTLELVGSGERHWKEFDVVYNKTLWQMLAPAVERLKWSEAQNGVEGPTEAHRWKWMHQEGFEFRNALFACLYNELFLVGLKPWPAGVAKLKTFEYNRVIVRDVLRRASLHAALGNFCPDTSGFVPRTKDFANTTPFCYWGGSRDGVTSGLC